MDDLVAFVTARLDEDEAAAKAATPGPWVVGRTLGEDGEWHYGSHVAAMGEEKRMLLDMNSGYLRSKHVKTAEHIARHDPARALRDVAAGRKLIAFALENAAEIDGEWGDGHDAAEIASGRCADHGAKAAAKILGPLAAIWDDHPGYRPEWKP